MDSSTGVDRPRKSCGVHVHARCGTDLLESRGDVIMAIVSVGLVDNHRAWMPILPPPCSSSILARPDQVPCSRPTVSTAGVPPSGPQALSARCNAGGSSGVPPVEHTGADAKVGRVAHLDDLHPIRSMFAPTHSVELLIALWRQDVAGENLGCCAQYLPQYSE
jgi:hypothetical protein